jgi:hypothetical protein
VTEDDDLFLAERAAKIGGDFDSVFRNPVEGNVRRLCPVPVEIVPSATLIPLHDCERFFPRLILIGRWPLRFAWSIVNHEQRRIIAIIALDAEPLVDPAN